MKDTWLTNFDRTIHPSILFLVNFDQKKLTAFLEEKNPKQDFQPNYLAGL
jgi:hypothetical protein